ncbi:hypothetical protein [Peijinzhouia sedimentorum]
MNYSEDIIDAVSKVYQISPELLKGASTNRQVIEAKKVYCLLSEELHGHVDRPLIQANYEKSRYYLRTAKDLLQFDRIFQTNYQAVKQQLNLINAQMSYKLNINQLGAVEMVIRSFMAVKPAKNKADKLIELHLDEIAEKLRKRVRAGKDNISLNEREVLSYQLWWITNAKLFDLFGKYEIAACLDLYNQTKP